MTTNTYLSTTESKNKLSKKEQKQNHRYRECFDGCHMGWESRGWAKKVKGLKVQIGSYRRVTGM